MEAGQPAEPLPTVRLAEKSELLAMPGRAVQPPAPRTAVDGRVSRAFATNTCSLLSGRWDDEPILTGSAARRSRVPSPLSRDVVLLDDQDRLEHVRQFWPELVERIESAAVRFSVHPAVTPSTAPETMLGYEPPAFRPEGQSVMVPFLGIDRVVGAVGTAGFPFVLAIDGEPDLQREAVVRLTESDSASAGRVCATAPWCARCRIRSRQARLLTRRHDPL